MHRLWISLGDKNEKLLYHQPDGSNTGTGSVLDRNPKGNVEQFQVRVGDDVINEIQLSKIEIITIDTEGFEPYVLRALAKIALPNIARSFF